MSREVLQMALEALENGKKVRAFEGGTKFQEPLEDEAITAIKEVLVTKDVSLAEQEPVALPDGKRLILVDGTFDELVYWLDRCDSKGHLERCGDLEEPWANFKYEDYTSPPQRQTEQEPVQAYERPLICTSK